MNELIASIRADLTDRRLLPAVALVLALLVAAVAYALLGGSGSSSAPHLAPSPGVIAPAGGLSVSGTQPEHAVAETTDGYAEQKSGKARNPFTPLAGTGVSPAASGAASTSSSSSSSSASSSTGSSSSAASSTTSAAGSTGASESTSSSGGSTSSGSTGGSGKGTTKKQQPKTIYDVAIEFGELPPGTTPEAAQLTAYSKLKLQTPLPSSERPLIVFRGVTAKGRSATFSLVGEAILSGTGACLPTASQCEAVDVKPGETEQLDYVAPNGQSTVYELRVLAITAEKTTAKTSSARWATSKAGEELLHLRGIVALPFLHYSTQQGVLVFAPRKAKAARARIAIVPVVG